VETKYRSASQLCKTKPPTTIKLWWFFVVILYTSAFPAGFMDFIFLVFMLQGTLPAAKFAFAVFVRGKISTANYARPVFFIFPR
jgi:hypothetical protein